ncbi:hypothetical protein H072_7630 [Dactylellina haptotyla CBS 200.50]|uniref:Uncharacterized protein n=1 Tax=Dactylellina haptotyla (strain CBS 200.50) TaxID=1284197 RepID=S8BTR6_DACHA|nr:hypothetical protein H072_7630 [Dactylellina haptotyla CBS 200.50]
MASAGAVTHVVAGAPYPPVGKVIMTFLIMITLTALSVCFTQRILLIRSWRSLTAVRWYILAIYVDSFMFVFSVGLITLGFGVNKSIAHCSAAVVMCIVFYETTKVVIEKVRLVRNAWLARRKDKLFLFNSFGMLIPYTVVCTLSLAYRVSYFKDGVCRIGMKTFALVPVVAFDAIVNVYLTSLFLIPVIKISKSNAQLSHQALRKMALITFFGSCATLVSSVANLTTLLLLKGEPGWVCLLLCNCDILFGAIVLHCITNNDHKDDDMAQSHNRDGVSDTAPGSSDVGARRSSFAKASTKHYSATPSVVFIGSRITGSYEGESHDDSSEKPSQPNGPGTPAERRSSRSSTLSGYGHESQLNMIQSGREQLDFRSGGPKRVPMPLNVRPITEYAEYDSDELEFITNVDIAEHGEVSDNLDDSRHFSSDEETSDCHKRYEERVPHKLV